MTFILAATGHRPPVLFPTNSYSKENKRLLVNFAKQVIEKNNTESHPITGIVMGGAQGWDQSVGWAAYELDIPFEAALPFQGMEAKWPKDSKDEFNYLLSLANKVTMVSEGGYENRKFYLRDKYMVDMANMVLALHNGQEEGGTAITVQYANKVKKPIINVWDEWLKYNK